MGTSTETDTEGPGKERGFWRSREGVRSAGVRGADSGVGLKQGRPSP